jgi:hypothetical protein
MITALPTVTVSAIYLAWKATQRRRRDRLLRERVAYMLWVAANGGESPPDEDDDDPDEPPDNDLERRLRTYSLLDRR